MPEHEIRREPAGGPAGRALVDAYREVLEERIPAGRGHTFSIDREVGDYEPPAGAWLVIYDPAGSPAACGGVRTLAPGVGEIKRMFVTPAARGAGLGRRLLLALEDAARELGLTCVRLDSHSALAEAVALYRASGYCEIPDYNASPEPNVWFQKELG